MSRSSTLKKARHGARSLPAPGALVPGRRSRGPKGIAKAVAIGTAVSSLRGDRRSRPRKVATHPAVIGAAIVAGGTVAVLANRRRIERSMAPEDSAWSEIVTPDEGPGPEDAPAPAEANETAGRADKAATVDAPADATAVPTEASKPEPADTGSAPEATSVDTPEDATAVPVEGAPPVSDAGDEVDEKTPNVPPPSAPDAADEQR